tara:strand:+ start:221 stop:502 length:282 start_codon:yes stop_codon:yes gene_type:complete
MEKLDLTNKQIAVGCELMKFGFEYDNFTEKSFVMRKKFKGCSVTAFIKKDGKVNGTDLERFLALSHANKEPVEPISIVPSGSYMYSLYLTNEN